MALTKKYRCNKQNFINADAHSVVSVVADCQSFYPIVSCLLFVLHVSLRTKNTRRYVFLAGEESNWDRAIEKATNSKVSRESWNERMLVSVVIEARYPWTELDVVVRAKVVTVVGRVHRTLIGSGIHPMHLPYMLVARRFSRRGKHRCCIQQDSWIDEEDVVGGPVVGVSGECSCRSRAECGFCVQTMENRAFRCVQRSGAVIVVGNRLPC